MLNYLKKNYLVIGAVLTCAIFFLGAVMWSGWASKIASYPGKPPTFFYTYKEFGETLFYLGTFLFAIMVVIIVAVNKDSLNIFKKYFK